MQMSQQTVIAGGCAGDAEHFSRLARPFYEPIFQFIARQVSSAADAADITQLVFIRAFGSFPRFDQERPFGPWIYRIARRTLIDHFRRASLETSPLDEAVCDPCRAPSESMEDREQRTEVWAYARRLKPKFHEILLLHYHEDFSIREIAEILGLSQTHVKVRLYRARVALRYSLEHPHLGA